MYETGSSDERIGRACADARGLQVAAAHGCLLVRDSESDGDISGWDPAGQPWFVDRGAAIFAVQHGGDGMVRCEVWRDGVEEDSTASC